MPALRVAAVRRGALRWRTTSFAMVALLRLTCPPTLPRAAKPVALSIAAVCLGEWARRKRASGPCVVLVREGEVLDLTRAAPTMVDLLEIDDLVL